MAENQGTQTENQSGDPGRTPGSAEGDRETVEQDLNEKNLDGKDSDVDKSAKAHRAAPADNPNPFGKETDKPPFHEDREATGHYPDENDEWVRKYV